MSYYIRCPHCGAYLDPGGKMLLQGREYNGNHEYENGGKRRWQT